MIRVILHGCNGKMGQIVTELCSQEEEIRIVAGVDAFQHGTGEYQVYRDIYQCNITADVVIDFSMAPAVEGLLNYCAESGSLRICAERLQRHVRWHAGWWWWMMIPRF